MRKNLTDIYAQFLFYVFYGIEDEIKLGTTALFNYFIQNFDDKINNNNTLKMIFLSGHDSTLAASVFFIKIIFK